MRIFYPIRAHIVILMIYGLNNLENYILRPVFRPSDENGERNKLHIEELLVCTDHLI